jgi:FecR protein
MKKRLAAKFAILLLACSGLMSIGAFAQTTEDGPGPTEQPSAPMEIGQGQPQEQGPGSQPYDDQNAQPQEAQPGGPSGEAPASTDQGVGRISLIHGDVSTQRGDSGDWSAAALNQPLMTGDKVSTAGDARAEVQLDFANTLRLGRDTKVNVANLTKKNIQIQVGEGLATYTVSKDSEAEPEIDTPNVSVHPSHHDGVFRIEVQPDGDTVVIVRKGEAQIATPQGSTEVREGEMATIRGTADSAQYKIQSAPDRDDWDRWNSDRDHIIRDANSWHHTNRYYTGSQDLDAYGQWRHVDDYGDVWYPNESSDWVPYRQGNWVWEPYYGWTWVGNEPWGWAPYHYGRWLWSGGAWGWWPGPVGGYYRPFWAPAYVSFWGWGGGFGFGVGFGGWGGFGWLPLGPCDWFHPWWGGYGGRFGWVGRGGWEGGRFGGIHPLHNGLRFSNVANIHDAHVGRAMSAVGARQFGAGRVGSIAARPEQLRGARMMAGNLPVVPTRSSLSASGRAPSPATIRDGGAQRFFGAHNNVARPASFQQQTASLRQTMQQNRVGAIPAGGRSNAGFTHSPSAVGTMQRPSAGIANRQQGSFGNREPQRGTSQPSSAQNRAGYRPFTPPSEGNRSFSGNSNASRPEPQRGTSQAAPAENRGGFRSFSPPSRGDTSRGGSNSSGGYWSRTAPSSSTPRSYSEGSGRGSSRPQLDMRQPIVRSPSYGGAGYPRGGYSPGYGGSRGGPAYSRPSYGGGGGSRPSAPSYGGGGHAPSGGGGGHYSGGGGGGHSGGGGGGHSGGGGHGGHH